MIRVLSFDAGFTMGFGALGGGREAVSGSRRLRGDARRLGVAGRHCDEVVRQLILQERPGVVSFATPFVGQIWSPNKGGKGGRFVPIQPDSIRPLMSFLTIIEMVCDELRIRCVEVDEPAARRAFLTAVPRKSAQIKKAIKRECRERDWPFIDEHAADGLCVASYTLEIVEPGSAHLTTPLFSAEQKPAKRRKTKA